jgi:hypothetical protein
MTISGNSEYWCRSKRQLNMTALVGSDPIIPVSCDPQILNMHMLYFNNLKVLYVTGSLNLDGYNSGSSSILICA